MIEIIIGIVAFIAGAGITYFISRLIFVSKKSSELKEIEAEAEVIKKKKMLEAKEHFLQLKAEHEKNG